MSRDQILTIVLLLGLIALFLWDRLRYDLVALLALLAAVGAGIVPADKAFNGFSNPILPLIAAALIVSVAIGQSGAIEVLLRHLNWVMQSMDLQVVLGDYWKLGLPLSVMVVVLGVPLIMLFWPVC